MGFYGNVINTTRTQFSFDRIYSNKYEMMTNASKDGVFAGRYVLVEYDKETSGDSFISTVYLVGNQAYLDLPKIQITDDFNVYEQPEAKNLIIGGTQVGDAAVTNGTIIRLVAGHHLYNLNESAIYIQVTGINFETGAFEYIGVSREDYIAWVGSAIREDLRYNLVENMSSEDFEYGIFYIKENDKYELALEYDPSEEYYIYGLGAKVYLVNNLNGYYSQISTTYTPSSGDMLIVRRHCSYLVNTGDELWQATINDPLENSIIWNQMVTDDKSQYYINFNIDSTVYPDAGRGYDSTVWQKIYSAGQQKYVMVAELNTLTPNFDIAAEPPTMTPIPPHFDTDSTNMYYKVHWQPQWGFRVKAASNKILGSAMSKTGGVSLGSPSQINLTKDEIYYPSDVATTWETDSYNVRENEEFHYYYNPQTGKWEHYEEDVNYKMKSAIYFNKAGFDSEKISYSKDLIDQENPNYDENIATSGWTNNNEILIQPTGYSGYIYSNHKGENPSPAVDTQEFSLMLPALGDNIAKIWDIIYGGRNTNDTIKETNLRNLDINWEDASQGIVRNGLRLVKDVPGSDGFIKTYNTQNGEYSGEINTLAGCLNSVHDLMGMILVNTTEEDLQNLQLELEGAEEFTDYKNIDNNKIYYFANDGTYRRRHQNFIFSEIDYIYEKIENINEDNYIKNFYYYLDESSYIPTYEDEYDSTREYYIKKMNVGVSDNEAFSEVTGLKDFAARSEHFPYQKTLKNDYIYDESDYADENVVYYSVTNDLSNRISLSGDYTPYTYYYYNDEDWDENLNKALKWQLDIEDQASSDTEDHYYQIEVIKQNYNLQQPEDFLEDNKGVYFYCPGFFYTLEYQLLQSTPNAEDIDKYYKKIYPDVIGQDQIYNPQGYIFVPLDSEARDYWFSYDNNGDMTLHIDPEFYNNNQAINLYICTNNLVRDEASLMTKNQTYYLITAESREEFGDSGYQIRESYEERQLTSESYITNKYYYYDDSLQEYIFTGDMAFDPSKTYFEKTIRYDIILPANTYSINKYQIQMKPYLPNTYYRIGAEEVVFTNDGGETFISRAAYDELEEDEQVFYTGVQHVLRYDLMTEETAEQALSADYQAQLVTTTQIAKQYKDYFLININDATSFYAPNRYYYNTYEDTLSEEEKTLWEEDLGFPYGDWVIDKSENMAAGRHFYEAVIATKEDGPYYKPEKYYYKDLDLNDYVLDYSERMRENTTYYLKNDFYILEDKTGKLSKGAIWKYYEEPIPCILKIATRESFYEMQELKGFSRTLNTIHGLILKLNYLLEIDDNLTRDTNTLQGCINTIKDIINKFDTLHFNQVLITDQYGKVITKELGEINVSYGVNNSKNSNLKQLFEDLDSLTFMTDAEMNSILNS